MKVAALCAGYGGLELGLTMAGVDVDLTWYAETDRHASQVMAHHHPDAPNLGDLTAITDPPPVDIVTAGFPCQPVSMAGKRKGITDERWLIDDVCRVARNTGADWLILENVAGLLTANGGDAMARVVSALAENGFDARWTCVRASDVGAPHQRLRWFCIADTGGVGRAERTGPGKSEQGRVGRNGPHNHSGTTATDADGASGKTRQRRPGTGNTRRREPLGDSRTPTPDPERQRPQGRNHPEKLGGHDPIHGRRRSIKATGRSKAPADADVPGRGEQRRTIPVPPKLTSPEHARYVATRFGPYADAIQRWEPIVGRAAPDPTDDRRRLNPRFVEWMMGLPDGWVTDAVDGRSHQLRILGNGVVPQQAAHALTILNGQP